MQREGWEGREIRHGDWLLAQRVFVSELLWIQRPLTLHISSPFNWTVTPPNIHPEAEGGSVMCPCWTDAWPLELAHFSQLFEHRQTHLT